MLNLSAHLHVYMISTGKSIPSSLQAQTQIAEDSFTLTHIPKQLITPFNNGEDSPILDANVGARTVHGF